MIVEVKIENYKSILSETIPLGRINVFIGENGCGKTNIIEAIAFFCASKDNDLSADGLFNRGIRVTKPSLTFSSFLNNRSKNKINIRIKTKSNELEENFLSKLSCADPDNIFTKWEDLETRKVNAFISNYLSKLDIPSIKELVEKPFIPNIEQTDFDKTDLKVFLDKFLPKD